MLLLAFMTSLFGSMALVLLLEERAARLQGDRIAAHYVARSGLAAAHALLLEDDAAIDCPADAWQSDADRLARVAVGEGYYDVAYAEPMTGRRRTGAVDEERKLNVNVAEAAMIAALHSALTDEAAEAIVARRAERRCASAAAGGTRWWAGCSAPSGGPSWSPSTRNSHC
jgi:hypothetical protein